MTTFASGDNVLMYPAGSGIAKVSTEKYSQEIISLANKVKLQNIAKGHCHGFKMISRFFSKGLVIYTTF